MPVAPRPMKSLDAPAAAPGVPAPAGGELFAILLDADAAQPEFDTELKLAAESAEQGAAQAPEAADTLLPLIEQQRAALVTPAAIPAPSTTAGTSAPAVPGEFEASASAASIPIAPDATAAAGADPAALVSKAAQAPEPAALPSPAATAQFAPAVGAKAPPEASATAPAAKPSPTAPNAPDQPVVRSIAQPLPFVPASGLAPGKPGKPSSSKPDGEVSPTTRSVAQAADPADRASTGPAPTIAPAPAVSKEPRFVAPIALEGGEILAAKPLPSDIPAAPLPVAAALTPAAGPTPFAPAPAASPLAQALAAQVLDIAADGAWIDDLARDISRMASGTGDLRFRLTPETLGELRVEISQTDRGAVIKMAVSSESAQAAIAEAQPRLLAEARAQGVRIADTQVDLASHQHQQRGEGQRQPSSQPDQPLRAFRSAHAISGAAGDRPAGPTERYA